MASSAPKQSPVQVLAAAATGLEAFLSARGLCADHLFGTVRLDPRLLETPTAAIGLDQYCAILEAASAKSGDGALGLDFGQQFRPDMLGLIGYVALSSGTMLRAAENLAKYFHHHQQSTVTTLSFEAPFWRLTYRVDPRRIAERAQDAAVTLGMFCNVFRHCSPDWTPDEVHLEQARDENWREIEQAFGAPAVFGQPTNALLFRPERAAAPMPHADPRLLDLLCANLTGLGMGAAPPSLVDQIRATIRERLGQGPLDLQTVSDALETPRWTLQRRLAEANANFAELLDEVRREVADRHLLDDGLQIGQVSERLGYAEVSAFTRAFKRWYDVSPAQYRKLLRQRLGR